MLPFSYLCLHRQLTGSTSGFELKTEGELFKHECTKQVNRFDRRHTYSEDDLQLVVQFFKGVVAVLVLGDHVPLLPLATSVPVKILTRLGGPVHARQQLGSCHTAGTEQ